MLERGLRAFIEALKVRFTEEGLLYYGRQIADWIVDERGNRGTWYSANRTADDVNCILIAMHDPIHVDEVEDLIAESARRYAANKEKLHDDGSGASASNQNGTCDSVMNLLDELHHSEIENFLNQTKISVPSSYWKRRAPYDIIWELQSVENREALVDWQYLCLRAERLCEESFGIINRSRICNMLREVKDRMIISLDDEDDDVTFVERPSSDVASTFTANTTSDEKDLVVLTDSDWE